MKSLLVFIRIILVGCLWGIVFTEGIRVIMLCNWHFDIFWPDHWRQAIELWQAGWKMHAPKEWAFVLLIVTFIPMLLTGWWTLSMVAWEDLIYQALLVPGKIYRRFIRKQINVITSNNPYGVVRRKSYKEIRPAGVGGIRTPISDYSNTTAPIGTTPMTNGANPAYMTAPFAGSSYAPPSVQTAPIKKSTDVSATIDHALFKFDDDDDDDFDLDIDSFEKADLSSNKKPEAKNRKNNYHEANNDEDENENRSDRRRRPDRKKQDEKMAADKHKGKDFAQERKRSADSDTQEDTFGNNSGKKSDTPHSPVYDALTQKNYLVVNNISVKNTLIDYVGVGENEICFCLVDKENGDWLADEEIFNGEDPLWFSENSHRISPVCRLDKIKSDIENKLAEEGYTQDLSFFVVIQMANIINADDMFEVWHDMNINVTRINRGAPKEIPLFTKTLNESEGVPDKKDIDKLIKTLKNLR